MNKDKVEEGIKMMLEGLGVDLNGSHFKDTPKEQQEHGLMNYAQVWENSLLN